MIRILVSFLFLLSLFSCNSSEISVNVLEDNSGEFQGTRVFLETKADGTGVQVKRQVLQIRSGSLEVFAVLRDDEGKFVQNTEVEWILSGDAGSLTVQSGGKSAVFNPITAGSAKVSFTVGDFKETVEFEVVNNIAPIFNFTSLAIRNENTILGGSYNIEWTDDDPDDDSLISLYFSLLKEGKCSNGSQIVSNISENNDPDNFVWDITGISDGEYYICAIIEDRYGSFEVWSNYKLEILLVNESPVLNFTSLNQDIVLTNQDTLQITWTDKDDEDNASIKIYSKNNNSGSCSDGSLIHSVEEDDSTNLYSWNVGLLPVGDYYVCSVIDDGVNSKVVKYSSKITIVKTCQWLGINSNFLDANNWKNCNGATPQATDHIHLIGIGADPIVSGSVSIAGIAANGLEQTITVASGGELAFKTDDAFLSDVTFKGDTPNCLTCNISLSQNNNFIRNGATLRLESGISIISQKGKINVGDGITHGHLEVLGGASETEWIQFKNKSPWGFYGIVLDGTSSAKSSILIQNVFMELYHSYASGSVKGIYLKNHYEVLGIDNIIFPTRFGDSQTSNLRLDNCANGIFTDSDWSNLEFQNHFGARSENIYVDSTTCTSIPITGSITMSGASGQGFGSIFEYDPNSLVTWYNETSGLCTWNGSVSSDWFDPINWSGCINGRGNYPDQFNDVYLPGLTPNSPSITSDITINSFETSGALGGDTITIGTGARLWITSQEINSNVTFKGGTDDCSDCVLGGDTLKILNNATVTVERGIRIRVRDGWYAFDVGDGVETGHLVLNANSTNQDYWPRFQPWAYYNEGIRVRGVDAANLSSVSINGLYSPMHSGGNHTLELVQFYELKQLDNVLMQSAFGWDMTESRILIQNCQDAVFSDLSWDQLDFISDPESPMVDGYNVEIKNCPSLPSNYIDITKRSGGTNAGFGQTYSLDPNNSIIWNP